MVRIHHVASAADWRAARRSGRYETSTRGRTLAEEGFIHASRPEQVSGTFERFYTDADEPLVLLTIDTDRLDRLGVRWQEDRVGDDTFPHVYGALPPEAVVAVLPLDARGRTPSFTSLFVREAVPPVLVAVAVMLVSAVGAVAAGARWGDGVTLPTALLLLVVGGAVGWWGLRRVRTR